MATANFEGDEGAWKLAGSGIITLTAHAPNMFWALGSALPPEEILGHSLPEGENVSMDTGAENVYIKGKGLAAVTA